MRGATLFNNSRHGHWFIAVLLLLPLIMVLGIERNMISTAIPVIGKDMHLSLVEQSYVLSAFWFFYALAMFPVGLWIQRLGSRRALTLAGVCATVFTALSTAVGGFISLFIVRSALGASQSLDMPAAMAAIANRFPASARGRGISFMQGGLYAGFLICPFITVAMMGAYGWRFPFLLFAGIGLVFTALWFAFFRDRIGGARSSHARVPAGSWQIVLKSRQVWALGLMYACTGLVQGFYLSWMPTYLLRARHFSLDQMGIWASLPALGITVSVFIVGPVLDRIRRRTGSSTKAIMPFGAGCLLGAAVLQSAGAFAPNDVVMLACFTLSYGCLGAVNVAMFAASQEIGRELTSAVVGFVEFFGNLLVAIGPVATALLVSLSNNWPAAISGVCISGLVGAVLWFFVHVEKPIIASSGETPAPAGALAGEGTSTERQ